ncbi:MAG: hypothetical protein H3Z54_06850 [archaeon]|nr:hypothetical protein [archaeon]
MKTKTMHVYTGMIPFSKFRGVYSLEDVKIHEQYVKKHIKQGWFIPERDMVWKIEKPIKILGWQGSISSFSRLHVKTFLQVYRDGKMIKEFGIINTGDRGKVNIGQFFPQPLVLEKDDIFLLGFWSHNMDFTWFVRDAHADYTLFYDDKEDATL